MEPPRASWRGLGGLEKVSLALKLVTFMVTLTMPQRTALDLEQVSCRIFFGKRFGRVWDDLGSVLRVVCRGKSGDFGQDIIERQVFRRRASKTGCKAFLDGSWTSLGSNTFLGKGFRTV